MKRRNLRLTWSLALVLALPFAGFSKGYSSGGGHSYSSHSSSSHSFSSGGGHSFSSGSSHSSSSGFGSSHSSGTKSFSSGSGKSYSSGSIAPGDRKGYSSGKSYSSGSKSGKDYNSSPGSSGFSFDQPAARARKEQASKSDYTSYKDSQRPPVIPRASGGDYSGRSSTYTRTVYAPNYTVIHTRPSRINVYFGSYSYRPWVYYHDPYSSLFWWWLLDRSIDEQAYWAYHHRYDMDPARYDALMASNQQLQSRVSQLETQQVARDPSYTPASLSTNQDLMYSDQYVNQAYQGYQNRPTTAGRTAFWVFGVPVVSGACVFFVWLVFFKRW
jgi:hypothetical protein